MSVALMINIFFFGIDREARHFRLDQVVCPGDRRNYPKADVFANFETNVPP